MFITFSFHCFFILLFPQSVAPSICCSLVLLLSRSVIHSFWHYLLPLFPRSIFPSLINIIISKIPLTPLSTDPLVPQPIGYQIVIFGTIQKKIGLSTKHYEVGQFFLVSTLLLFGWSVDSGGGLRVRQLKAPPPLTSHPHL